MSRPWVGLDRRERILAATLTSVVVLSAQAVGTVHPITLVVMSLLAAGGLWLASRTGRASDRVGLGVPVVVMAVLIVLCLVQAAPIPLSILERIAPGNADIWNRALTPLGGEVHWGHISLDPGATLREALKGVLYVAVFVTASRLSVSRGPTTGVTIVFASAVLVAIVSLLHWLVGATSVFGVYTPVNPIASLRIGPLLNPNNLAGYLNLGLLCGFGLICARKPPTSVGLLGVGIAIVVAMTVRAGSRGGLLVLPLALVAFAIALVAIRRRRRERHSALVPVVAISGSVLFGVALAVLGSDTRMWADYSSESLDKLVVVGWVRLLIADFTWVGIGRGSFESVFPAYRPVGQQHTVFTHAENLPAQWAAEWGVIFGIGALLVFAYLFRPRRMHFGRTSVATGAWLAVLVLVVQNLGDLSLELAGVTVAMVAVLGTLWGSRRAVRRAGSPDDASEPELRAQRLAPKWAVPAIGGAAVVLSTAVLVWGRNDIAATRHALTDELAAIDPSDAAARERYRGALHDALLDHPADPHLPLLGGVLAWRARDQSPMPWIQRSLERGLMNGRAHLLLAEVLASRGATKQALLELRWALRSEPGLVEPVGVVAARLARDIDDVRQAAPEGQAGAKLLVRVSERLAETNRRQLADQCDLEALNRDPTLTRVRARVAERRLTHLEDGEVCPDRDRCREEIRHHASRLEELEPRSSLGAQARARLILLDGKHSPLPELPEDVELSAEEMTPEELGKARAEAASRARSALMSAAAGEVDRLLERACREKPDDRSSCLRLHAETVAKHLREDAKLADLLKRYARAQCRTAQECANTHRWIGGLRASQGQWGLAFIAYEKAAKSDPSEQSLKLLAEAAERAQRYGRAIDALQRLEKQSSTPDPERQTKIVELQKLAATEQALDEATPR